MKIMTIPPIPEAIHRQAAAHWFSRLRGDCALEDWTLFRDWLEADPRNPPAYDEVEALWLDLDEDDPLVVADDDRSIAPSARPANDAAPARRRWPVWLWSATALTAAAAGVVVMVSPALKGAAGQTYATEKGEVRTITLADGSALTLGADTRLRVRLARTARDVVMTQGEASFDVAHDAARPFTVQAGDQAVRVLGTEFNILRADQRVTVTVRRGLVQVSDPTRKDVHRLTSGDQLINTGGAARSTVRKVAPDPAFAWKTGRLTYENASLSEVAADLNRYGATPIRVDLSARDVTVTGVLLIDKEAVMLRRLELFAPVIVERTRAGYLLKARDATP